MKLGLLTAAFPDLTLDEVAAAGHPCDLMLADPRLGNVEPALGPQPYLHRLDAWPTLPLIVMPPSTSSSCPVM